MPELTLNNISFIYSGSHKHLMMSIFADKRNAFYRSSNFLDLGYIPKVAYENFILEKFNSGKKVISDKIVKEGLDWCMGHTFYVQYLFNHLFGNTTKKISEIDLQLTKNQIQEEHALIFDNYRKLLSKGQFRLLKALTSDIYVKQPNAGHFINKHNLGSVSSVNQAFRVLRSKNFIIEEPEGYRVGDVFFMRWMGR